LSFHLKGQVETCRNIEDLAVLGYSSWIIEDQEFVIRANFRISELLHNSSGTEMPLRHGLGPDLTEPSH
jgi:hypothetical protein